MLKYNGVTTKSTTPVLLLALVAASALALAAPAAALAQFSMDDDAGIPAPPPAAAPGQLAVDEEAGEPGAPPWGIVPEDPAVGHVAVVNELMDAHRDLTGIMEAQAGGDYGTPDYPFVMTNLIGSNAELVGGLTASTGDILYKNVTVKFPSRFSSSHTINTDQMVASYTARSGDSGAPVIHTDSSGNSKLLGTHVGRVDEVVLDSTGEVVHGDPTSRDSTGLGPRQFSIFAPWENIKDALDIKMP